MTPAHPPLHPLELRILLVLHDGPAYGTAIVEAIERREPSGRLLYPANLFRRIRDLLRRGYITECDAPAGADPRRSYVKLTRVGRSAAQAEVRRLEQLLKDAAAHGVGPS